VVGAAPEATRDPCFARCRVFFGAASAIDDSVNAAIKASITIFIVLAILVLPKRAGFTCVAATIARLPMNAPAEVRRAIYSTVVDSGRAPTPRELSTALDLSADAIADAYRGLADAHVIVLRPGTVEIVWAPPFSAIETPFRSHVGSSSWYAPCAWDAFGIPAALKGDAVIDARCGRSNERIECGVSGGAAYGEAVIHLLVPAAQFWDDIGYT
jgi:hypothetical protein